LVQCCTCVIRGRWEHTVSAESGGHTSCFSDNILASYICFTQHEVGTLVLDGWPSPLITRYIPSVCPATVLFTELTCRYTIVPMCHLTGGSPPLQPQACCVRLCTLSGRAAIVSSIDRAAFENVGAFATMSICLSVA